MEVKTSSRLNCWAEPVAPAALFLSFFNFFNFNFARTSRDTLMSNQKGSWGHMVHLFNHT